MLVTGVPHAEADTDASTGTRIRWANSAARTLFEHHGGNVIGARFNTLIQTDSGANLAPETPRPPSSGDNEIAVTVPATADAASSRHMMHVAAVPDTELRIVQLTPAARLAPLEQRLTEEQRFRSALMELSQLAHSTEDDDDFYQRLLERAVDVVPGAQGGSVQLQIHGASEFRFVAAVGYDLKGLQLHTLGNEHFFRDTWDPTAQIIREFGADARTPEITEWLMTVGRLSEIQVNVSGPALSDGYPVAFLSLDNFEDPDAMNETSIEMTTVLSQLIAELWQRRQLEAELRKEREAFKQLALHDPLTGLANRRSLERTLTDTVDSARIQGRPTAVLFVDIDDFKGVNDRLGHAAGDSLLEQVSMGLLKAVRQGDTVGRWGGDEFLIVPYRLNSFAEAQALARRVLARFEDEVALAGGLTYRARISVGVGWSSEGKADVDRLIRAADAALYEAKGAGKGVYRVQAV